MNSTPDDKFKSGTTLLKGFDRAVNLVAIAENAGYHNFLLFPRNVFKRTLCLSSLIQRTVIEGLLTLNLICQFWAIPIQQKIKYDVKNMEN